MGHGDLRRGHGARDGLSLRAGHGDAAGADPRRRHGGRARHPDALGRGLPDPQGHHPRRARQDRHDHRGQAAARRRGGSRRAGARRSPAPGRRHRGGLGAPARPRHCRCGRRAGARPAGRARLPGDCRTGRRSDRRRTHDPGRHAPLPARAISTSRRPRNGSTGTRRRRIRLCSSASTGRSPA